MPSEKEMLFAKIVIASKFATQEQIQECLQLQQTSAEALPAIMVKKQILTREQAELAIKKVQEVNKKTQAQNDLALQEEEEDIGLGPMNILAITFEGNI